MVWEILAEALDGVGKVEQSNGVNGRIKVGLKGKCAREVAEMAVQVVGDYVCTYIFIFHCKKGYEKIRLLTFKKIRRFFLK